MERNHCDGRGHCRKKEGEGGPIRAQLGWGRRSAAHLCGSGKVPIPSLLFGGHYEWEKEEGKGEKEQKGKRKEGTP